MSGMSAGEVWEILEEVKDPEIPVISLVDLGLVRQVAVDEERVKVVMTPTFSGCPALQVMQEQVEERLREAGFEEVEVQMSREQSWTSDWITPSGREKLKEFGLAPPPLHEGDMESAWRESVRCPYCDSTNTDLRNSFGPTLCRAIFFCNNCQQPFEQFKPL